MVNCSKLQKNKCLENPEYCNWVSGKGCKSLHTQRTRSKSGTKQTSLIKTSVKKLSPIKETQTKKSKTTRSKRSSPSTSSLKIKYKLIDSGTYGCVINPPFDEQQNIHEVILPYKNKESSDIAKIYKDGAEEFNDELELLEKVQEIDPKNKFTTKIKGAMVIDGETINNATVSSCLTKKKAARKYYHQLILENGGVRTDKSYRLTYPDFLRKFKVFLKGMLKLQSKNFVHMDIKPANVLISDKKINLIDFGLMTYASRIFTYNNRHALGYLEYPYYPPEFYISYSYLKYGEINKDRLETLFNQDFLTKPGNSKLLMKYHSGVTEFIQSIRQQISKFKHIWEIFSNDLAKKADVFSIAYIIIALNQNIRYSRQVDEENEQKNFVDTLYERCIETNPYKRISMEELYNMVSNEYAKYNSSSSAGKSSKDSSVPSSSSESIYLLSPVSSKSSLSVSRGGNLKIRKTNCDKVPKYMLRVEMSPGVKRNLRKSCKLNQ